MERMTLFGDEQSSSLTIVKGKPAYGIDLGTTNSAISVLPSGKIPSIIELDEKAHTLPSCVTWDSDTDTFIVGRESYEKRYQENTIYSVKRLMGTDEKIILKDKGKTRIMTPAEVSAEILKELCRQASKTYGKIEDVVITVPAYFNNKQLEDTRKAGELAGLNVLSTLREPTSASLVYNNDDSEKDSLILVYDLGGGTFDTSLEKISHKTKSNVLDLIYGFENKVDGEESGNTIISVLKTEGDSRLGGDDIDREMFKLVSREIESMGIDLDLMPLDVKETIILKLEKFKKSGIGFYDMSLDYTDLNGNRIDTYVPVYETFFLDAANAVYKKTKKLVDLVLSGVEISSLDSIVLVGGSTKSEAIRSLLKRDFPNTKIDCALNPDESVALGAAIQANRLKYGDSSVQVFDVLPLAIGVLSDNIVSKIINKNQAVPFSATRMFATTSDNQELVQIQIYQGNSTIKEECTYLGDLIIDDLPKAKAGELVVYVNLAVNAEGILKCSVRVRDKIRTITLTNLFKGDVTPTTNLDVNAKKLNRWRNFSLKLNESDRQDFGVILNKYEHNPSKENEKIVTAFIKKHRVIRAPKTKLTVTDAEGLDNTNVN